MDAEETAVYLNSPESYSGLDDDTRLALSAWIRNDMTFGQVQTMTSYGLKHRFEEATDIYVTNGQFKGAMLAEDIQPLESSELNWRFNLRSE